jgi:hypothetical protein
MAAEAQADTQETDAAEPNVLTRVMAATMALLGFAVVCLSGLVQGNSFVSVIKCSLVGLAAGAAGGAVAALVVRAVVTENFNRRRAEEDAQQPAASAEQAAPSAGAPPAGRVGDENQTAAAGAAESHR